MWLKAVFFQPMASHQGIQESRQTSSSPYFPRNLTVLAWGPFSPRSSAKWTSAPTSKVIEPRLKNTVAVEVDLTSIGCFQKTIFLFGKQFGDARTGRTLMQ